MAKKNSPNQFDSWELDKSSVISKMETATTYSKNIFYKFLEQTR
jgi:hypothetical protein